MLVAGEIDRRTGRLPLVVLWPGIAAVITCGVAGALAGEPAVLSSAAAAALPYVGAHAAGQAGGGDVKLGFIVGGLVADPLVALAAVGVAQLVGLAGFVLDRRTRRPHGPALAGVAALAVLAA
nr:prepilin peptidase [Gordonia araii]